MQALEIYANAPTSNDNAEIESFYYVDMEKLCREGHTFYKVTSANTMQIDSRRTLKNFALVPTT